MNKKTHLALSSLSLAGAVRYQGVIRRAEFEQKLSAVAQPVGLNPPVLTDSMAILVFGVRSIGAALAKEFSKRRLFLQHPNPMPQYISYENPQYLTIVASSLPNGAFLPPISVTASQPEDGTARSNSANIDDDTSDVIAVIDNLPQQEYLSEANIDERVTTPLLR